jgi:hypothetical protein
MSNKLQILRTATAGNPVPAGTYPPGTPWVNFPDLKFGIIDLAQNPQNLLGVSIYAGTADYVVGDIVANAGKLYKAKNAVTGVIGGTFNAADWDEIGAGASVTVGATPPASPKLGSLWYEDANDGRIFVWDGTQWVDAAPVDHFATTLSPTAPTSPGTGDLWFDSTAGTRRLFVWDGAAWIDAAPAASTAGFVAKAGDTMTGQLVVPGGATGKQAPAADEVVQLAGDTMTGALSAPNIRITGDGVLKFGDLGSTNGYLHVIPTDGSVYLGGGKPGTSAFSGGLKLKKTGGNITGIVVNGKTGISSTVFEADSVNSLLIAKLRATSTPPNLTSVWSAAHNAHDISVGASSETLKDNIRPLTSWDTILKITPILYEDQNVHCTWAGLTVEDCEEQGMEGIIIDNGPEIPKGLAYDRVVPYLIKAVQELTTRLEALEAK